MIAAAAPILIGLGANLPSPAHGSPRETLEAALEAFPAHGLTVTQRSPWYESSPVPPSDQPWFVNGVAAVETGLGPRETLAALLAVEQSFGRERGERWAARTLDLDLLAYGAQILDEPAGGGLPALILPHPRLKDRRFVLLPLREIEPDWRHPVTGQGIEALLAALDDAGEVRRMGSAQA